jgi:hypothetical protein
MDKLEAGHAGCKREMINAYRILERKPGGKILP